MLTLALDTSTPRVSVALVELDAGAGATVLAAYADEAGTNRHGELLAPGIARVLADAGVTPGELRAVACGVGPGPFTGLRVGVVTAASTADALGIPAYAVCSLDAIADRHRGRPLVVVTDARRRQVYWARYDESGRRVDGPDIAEPAHVAAHVAAVAADAVVVGAGLRSWREAFGPLPVDESDPWPEAGSVATLAAARVAGLAPAATLVPLYLRRPDATPPAGVKKVTPA